MTRVPSATVGRLVTYFRIVSAYDTQGKTHITSSDLANETGVTAFLVRKDLNHLKDPDHPVAASEATTSKASAATNYLGTRGAGYDVKQLKERLWERLGLTTPWGVAIVGMGRLGRAIADYPSLIEYNFVVRAGFDVDAAAASNISKVTVYPMEELAAIVHRERITIAFLTVPADAAQGVAEQLAEAGVRGILNFTPAVLDPPDGVHVESVDFMAGLKRLSYFLHAPGTTDEPASSG